jgi:N-acetylglutamate synthase-like GNAT family acetyltransferase
MPISLELATESDLPAIVALMNAAFRAPEGERGWSTEGGLIAGTRITESLLRQEIGAGAQYLVVKDAGSGDLQGCVSLKWLTPELWHLGSLTVNPALQNTGFGRNLLEASEAYAAAHGAVTIEMTVVSVRDVRIVWYERRGYRLTGETRPFPYGDDRYGTPMRGDLEFVVLEKRLITRA